MKKVPAQRFGLGQFYGCCGVEIIYEFETRIDPIKDPRTGVWTYPDVLVPVSKLGAESSELPMTPLVLATTIISGRYVQTDANRYLRAAGFKILKKFYNGKKGNQLALWGRVNPKSQPTNPRSNSMKGNRRRA